MKTRLVFTVIREYGELTLAEFTEELETIKDEAGEFLYGGNGGDE